LNRGKSEVVFILWKRDGKIYVWVSETRHLISHDVDIVGGDLLRRETLAFEGPILDAYENDATVFNIRHSKDIFGERLNIPKSGSFDVERLSFGPALKAGL